MSVEFTKDDLSFMHSSLARLLPPGGRTFNAAESVRADEVMSKLHARIVAALSAPERGELVFSWRVPREWAMTLNEYAGKQGWAKKKIKQALDDDIRKHVPSFPKAMLHGAKVQRWVRVTRFSSRKPDEISVDSIGGKCPVDALVRCGVLHDDNQAFVIREPRWEKSRPGNTNALIEVFEVAAHQVATPEPTDSEVTQIVHAPGFMTKAIMGR
jgi:hypothetical protein